MDYDLDKVDDMVLALLLLTQHDTYGAWKGYDWDVMNRAQGVKALQTSNKHNQWVTTVAWSIDGSYIASGSWDKTVQIIARDSDTSTEK